MRGDQLAAPHLSKVEAVVLRRHDLGEADRVVTLYTDKLGKVRAVAKGIRRTTSRLGGHLELFAHIQVMLARGRNLDTITQVDTIESFVGIREDLWRTSLAYYVAELVDRLTEENVEHRELFAATIEAYSRIATTDRPSEAMHHFELRALDALGFRPEVKVCVRCRTPLRPPGNAFSPLSGGILCPDCRVSEPTALDISPNAIRLLRLYLSNDWATTSRLRIEPELADEIGAVLLRYTHSVAEASFKSESFIRELRLDTRYRVPQQFSEPILDP